jgi:hypothetical protein
MRLKKENPMHMFMLGLYKITKQSICFFGIITLFIYGLLSFPFIPAVMYFEQEFIPFFVLLPGGLCWLAFGCYKIYEFGTNDY